MPFRARLMVVFGTTTLLLIAIVATFWYQDWRYSRPTPRPLDLRQPELGTRPELPSLLSAMGGAGPKPLFLHVFNPKCPCSRFNVEHVRRLARDYDGRARFVAVLEGKGDAQSLLETFASARLPMSAIPDAKGAVARALGVYSTPQAVILDAQGRLTYRGNYNLSRYCSDSETEFARIALDSLLAAPGQPARTAATLAAYGCPLPAGWTYPQEAP